MMRIQSLVICFVMTLFFMNVGAAEASVINVDDDKLDYPGAAYSKIQDAVNSAYDGDTILVYPGTYEENLLVNKPIIIKSNSENPDNTIIKTDKGVKVTADYVTISGLSSAVKNSPFSAV